MSEYINVGAFLSRKKHGRTVRLDLLKKCIFAKQKIKNKTYSI